MSANDKGASGAFKGRNTAVLNALLPRRAPLGRGHVRGAGAPGVDVQAASAGVAGVDQQPRGAAVAGDVHEDALCAVLVKVVVRSKAHQIAQQRGLVDLRSAVLIR